jgi:hypothetical protein
VTKSLAKGWLCHGRLAYVGMRNLATFLKDRIIGLSNVRFEKDRMYCCQAEKQVVVPHPRNNIVSTKKP